MTAMGLLPMLAVAAVIAGSAGGAEAAEPRARADVACQPAAKALNYECTIRLSDAGTGAPLSGVDLTVSAEMPSMPMAHNMRPVKATAGTEPGLYHARIELEMQGDWALQLNLTGRIRDRVIRVMRFDDDGTRDGAPARTPPMGHKK
jgi:hypothetical protein